MNASAMLTRRTALVAGLTLVPTLGSWRTAAAGSAPSAPEGRIRLPSGRRIGYAEYGDPAGPLVFYFHGTPGGRVETSLIAEEAQAAAIRLVVLERPGIGLSDSHPSRRILDWPADVECAAAALGYAGTSFGVIGLSGGAPYALACMKCIPQRLTHVAVVSGHTPLHVAGAPRGSADNLIDWVGRRPRLARMAFNVAIGQLHRRPNHLVKKLTADWAESDKELILCDPVNYAALLRTLHEATRCGPDTIVTDVRLLGGDWGYRLGDLPPASVSFWQGGGDPIVPASMGRHFHRQVAGSELIIDPAAGHLTMPKWHAAEILGRFSLSR